MIKSCCGSGSADSWQYIEGTGALCGAVAPSHLHHLLPDVDDVQPVIEAGVAVELGRAVAQGHAQLALPLPVDVVNELHLRDPEHKL